MVRSSFRALCTLSALLLLTDLVSAQQKKAYELLPDTVQAVVYIPNSDELLESWDRTQLARLAADPAVRPFFEEQRQAIEARFMEAGWRLKVTPEDIQAYATGQIAVAWLELPRAPRKPFALAMIADVEDDVKTNQRLLAALDKQLSQRQPGKATLQHAGVTIAKYTMPKRADQLLAENVYYAISMGQLIATDDEQLIMDIVSRIGGQEVAGPTLAADRVFVEGRDQLKVSGEAQVEYFVRPLGVARVFRSIGGKRSKSNADLLAVLENQGFSAIKCICGEIALGRELVDVRHRGYVLVDRPLPKSAGILDFPNNVTTESPDVPSFVSGDVSSYLTMNWNSQEAFWRAEGLVDELAGTPGVFVEVIEGIKRDPNGPRIDIEQAVLPQLTNDIFAIADNRPGPADIDSRRNLIALRVKNTQAMAGVIDRAMGNEPDAELVEFNGHPIWQVVHRNDQELDLGNDFGDFGAPAQAPAAGAQPWLTNWAITVYDGYLMFASHVDLIQEAITQSQSGASPLMEDQNFIRVAAAVVRDFGEEPGCVWQFVQNSVAYRVQYELFREGKLQDSQSMLASVLENLLQTDSEIKEKTPRVDGKKLPPFSAISHFLQPSGFMCRSTEHGWEFGGLLLSDAQAQQQAPNAAADESGSAQRGSPATEIQR